MRRLSKVLVAMLCGVIGFSFAGCGSNAPKGSVEINFMYDISLNRTNVYKDLIKEYNDGQGKDDKVYVVGMPRSGIADKAYSNLSKKSVTSNVYTLGSGEFNRLAMEGYLLELDSYVSGETPLDLSDIPETIVNRYRFNATKNSDGKFVAGEGAPLVAVPNGIRPNVLYYHTKHFNTLGINVISVSEAELKTSTQYSSVMPHGYAEYISEPYAGAVSSVNLAGETVYKVFNTLIPMNWEEFRNLAKCFTKAYNSTSPSNYGYMGEYWYQYGWSVGGDCTQWDGEKYVFTLADNKANYLAVQDVTVNDKLYHSGEIVSYEDKIKDTGIGSKTELYELPSQETALKEFLALGLDASKDGYHVMNMDDRGIAATLLSSGAIAMYCESTTYANVAGGKRDRYCDVAPLPQYREYVDGSTYQKGGSGFANEYLKVIGKEYDNVTYTGKLKTHDNTENGTPIVGRMASFERGECFVIPKNSDASKYEAAWKFIRWAAGKEGQTILATNDIAVPNQISLMQSNEWLNATDKTFANRATLALIVSDTKVGDMDYFENNEWVSAWSTSFNASLRFGGMSLNDFMNSVKTKADAALASKTIYNKAL